MIAVEGEASRDRLRHWPRGSSRCCTADSLNAHLTAAMGLTRCSRDERPPTMPGPRGPRAASGMPIGRRAVEILRKAVDRGLLHAPEPLRDEEFLPLRTRPDFIETVQGAERPSASGDWIDRLPILSQINFNVYSGFADLEEEAGWNRPAACPFAEHGGGERDMRVESILGALGLGLLLSSVFGRGQEPDLPDCPPDPCRSRFRRRGGSCNRQRRRARARAATPAPDRAITAPVPARPGASGRSSRLSAAGQPASRTYSHRDLGEALFPSAMAGGAAFGSRRRWLECELCSGRGLLPRLDCSAAGSSGAGRISR